MTRKIYFIETGLTNVSSDRFNKMQGFWAQNIIRAAMNAGNSTHEYLQLYFDNLTSDSGSATNFTYDSSNDWYENTGTGQAVVEWTNILSLEKINTLNSHREAVVEVVADYAGDVSTAEIDNASFETAGGTTFSNWTEGGSGSQAGWSQDTNYVTEGSNNAKCQGGSDSTSYNDTLTQTIDVTNMKYVAVDAKAERSGAGSAVITATLDVDGTSDSINHSTTQTLVVDVRAKSGNVTLTLTSDKAANGTNSHIVSFDNVRYTRMDSDTNNSVTIKLANDGTTFSDTVTNGVPYRFSSDITQLGIRIENTKTDGESAFENRIKGVGIVWG